MTLGSVAAKLGYFPELYRAICDALADVSARILITTGPDGDLSGLGPLPTNVHVERWVAQEQVMPHAAVVVCHAGYGTLLGALAAGLPVVAMPLFAGDQWHNARRLHHLGAGIALQDPRPAMFDHPRKDLIAALPRAVRRVLHEERHRAAARRIASASAALPTVDAAADRLRDIAGNPAGD